MQRLGLHLQRRCRRRNLLNQRGVLLRHAVHLRNGNADLRNAFALLLRGLGDLLHDHRHVGHGFQDGRHGLARFIHQARPFLNAGYRIGNQRFDLFCSIRAAAGEVTHFAGHDRKASALLTGTRRFHRGVKRQNIGLEGDAVDNGSDLGNLLRTERDAVHGFHHVIHQVPAAPGGDGGGICQFAGFARVIGVEFHRRGQLFHAGGGLLQRRGLLFST